MARPVRNLRAYLDLLRRRGEVIDVSTEVDPHLEVAEIHRRVTAKGGPVLVFRNPKGAAFPLVTNLFGTVDRVQAAFGRRPREFVERAVEAVHTLSAPSLGGLWRLRGLAWDARKIGLKKRRTGPVTEVVETPDLTRLPATTSWHSDGGPFFTLPLVYTQHPETGKHNLGMYRMQVHSPTTTGMHFQIHKGGGFHFHEAERDGRDLPATVFLGGPPALILAAIAPLPEDVPELILASLLLGERLPVVRGRCGHPLVAECEFALHGHVAAGERRAEGPFGDHYGYNSLAHDYPVFHVERVFRRRDALFPATVVGRPRQEDFHIGDYLQDLLAPLFPVVMPSVKDIWAYGETGFHSLAAARVTDRYPREAIVSGLRILGEGQLSLTKCLLLTDGDVDLHDFRAVLPHWLERCEFEHDLIVLGATAMDTLDYTGPMVNRGSKALFLGLGEPRRELPTTFDRDLPPGVVAARPFCPGCLVLAGKPYAEFEDQARRVAREEAFREWPLLVLVDDLEEATASTELFLWTVFTRFEPAGDLFAREMPTTRFHTGLVPPVVFDARLRPTYPEVLAVDDATRDLVDRRWREYGIPS
ncbi:MAG: UbiD family decarboxylase [Planctomycetota bacterium]